MKELNILIINEKVNINLNFKIIIYLNYVFKNNYIKLI